MTEHIRSQTEATISLADAIKRVVSHRHDDAELKYKRLPDDAANLLETFPGQVEIKPEGLEIRVELSEARLEELRADYDAVIAPYRSQGTPVEGKDRERTLELHKQITVEREFNELSEKSLDDYKEAFHQRLLYEDALQVLLNALHAEELVLVRAAEHDASANQLLTMPVECIDMDNSKVLQRTPEGHRWFEARLDRRIFKDWLPHLRDHTDQLVGEEHRADFAFAALTFWFRKLNGRQPTHEDQKHFLERLRIALNDDFMKKVRKRLLIEFSWVTSPGQPKKAHRYDRNDEAENKYVNEFNYKEFSEAQRKKSKPNSA